MRRKAIFDRSSKMHRHELTDDEWARLQPLLPPAEGARGRPAMPMRIFLNAVLFIAKTGAPWRDLPIRFGPWKTIHNRFSRWNARGVLQRVFAALAKDADHESNIADSTYSRAHQHAAGGKGGPNRRALASLAGAQRPSSMFSWMPSGIPSISTSRPATFTTSPRRHSSSP